MSNPTGIEALVCADIALRQALGIRKYGQTVAENPLPLRAWLQHGYEEALDLAVYLRRTIAEIDAHGDTMPAATACLALASQQIHGRTEAAETVSRLLDAQTKEIKRLRGEVARLGGDVMPLADLMRPSSPSPAAGTGGGTKK